MGEEMIMSCIRDIKTGIDDMAYSRKGRLIFRGALFAVAAAWAAFVLLLHPSRNLVPYVAVAVLIVCLVLAIRAFLYLDEVEQARRLRVASYGAIFGVWVTTSFLLFLTIQPSMLEGLADMLIRHRPHLPLEYFGLGVMAAISAQCLCGLLASLVLRLKPAA